MRIRHYNVTADVKNNCKIALVADLHDRPFEQIIDSFNNEHPDFIAVNGDLLYAVVKGRSIYEHEPESQQHFKYARYANKFLRESVRIAPVLFSTGNHELHMDKSDKALLKDIGVIFLDDSFQDFGDLVFGGLSSSYKYLANSGVATTKEEHQAKWDIVFDKVNTSWLGEFEKQKGYKILLCHHPELYDRFLRGRNIDLVLSGHAHGGQIRLLGRGLFAYGQGWFPKYTCGIYDQKLIVSSGLANTSRLPRIGNPQELVYCNLASSW